MAFDLMAGSNTALLLNVNEIMGVARHLQAVIIVFKNNKRGQLQLFPTIRSCFRFFNFSPPVFTSLLRRAEVFHSFLQGELMSCFA